MKKHLHKNTRNAQLSNYCFSVTSSTKKQLRCSIPESYTTGSTSASGFNGLLNSLAEPMSAVKTIQQIHVSHPMDSQFSAGRK